ncbi:Holliday junction resolvase [Haloarcula tailed virus 2]|uniref:Holliday junction resolvase n=1 Tax=Haloarcula tailed virus 2 TaxID=2877989 RepID=A0AAE8Y0M9_9CAUD|nr:Holliday junction resolvase [Haloarcula tailed virus 2]UBF23194.1 Holliday junction resolvase [Haloarcula tailed virus 2]
MRRDTSRSANDLNRPEGNSLLENYDVHDIAESYVIQRLEDLGFRVEAWGMDKRHDNDGLLFEDDRVDLKVFDGDELVLLVEVKSKSAPHYMGSLNKRHIDKYCRIAESESVPTYIAWCRIDADSVKDTFITPCVDKPSLIEKKFTFPDGNKGVQISPFYQYTWDVIERLK